MSNFTDNVLSSIKDPELRKSLHLDKDDKEEASQVCWISKGLRHITSVSEDGGDFQPNYPGPDDKKPYQQIDLLRKFYLTIAEKGLAYAYQHSEFTPKDIHISVPKGTQCYVELASRFGYFYSPTCKS